MKKMWKVEWCGSTVLTEEDGGPDYHEAVIRLLFRRYSLDEIGLEWRISEIREEKDIPPDWLNCVPMGEPVGRLAPAALKKIKKEGRN